MNTEKDFSFGQAAPTVVFDNTTPFPFHPEVTLRQLIENWAQYETLSELCLRNPEMQAQYLDTVKSFYDTAYACLRRLLLLTRKDPKNENGVQLSQLYRPGDNQILSIESLVKGKRQGSDRIHHLLFVRVTEPVFGMCERLIFATENDYVTPLNLNECWEEINEIHSKSFNPVETPKAAEQNPSRPSRKRAPKA